MRRHPLKAALLFCQLQPADWAILNGVVRVHDGAPLGIDLVELVARHNRAAQALVARADAR